MKKLKLKIFLYSEENILNFNILKLIYLLFINNAVCVFFKKSFPIIRSKIHSPKFSSKSFNVLFLTCKTSSEVDFLCMGSFRDSVLSYSIWKIILFSSAI